MKLVCQGAELSDAVLKVVKACAGKTTVPVLECIKLSAKNDLLSLLATDGEISIEKVIRAEVLEEGSLCVPGKYFAEFISKVSDVEITLTTGAKGLEIKYADAVTTMQILPPDDFPLIDISISEDHFVMDRNDFRALITKTAFCCATDDSRPILKGCLLEIGQKEITVTALDGYRLAVCTRKVLSATGEKRIICPARTLLEIVRMLPQDEGTITVFLQRGMLMVEVEDTILTSRLFTGDFVNRDAIMPKEFQIFVTVKKSDLEESISRAAVLLRGDKSNLIILDLKGDSLGVSSSSDIGGVSEVVKASVQGPDLRIAVNAKYISECVRAVSEEIVYLEMNTPVTPFIVHGEERSECNYLILPVRSNY